ncbi:DUF3857 and transglutaminase domain-containing protein [Sphingobacterium tabacisoli]|uniref:DUF3857 and transglutaminase domain-containing protein n=1 Tax=Sphingobacterium tabacisoli TaxID=2044855 RepID=A0ABW5LBF1_9SPHI|nr:DUF3857 and transglutaminase domain-containing protein [Sphingobacterium tabacisoli]
MAQLEGTPTIGFSDFETNVYDIDSSAHAITLFEHGKTHIDKSESDRSLMVFHHYKTRLKILTKEGYEQANFTIPLYKYGSTFEYITNIKATTYNLVNGKIESTPLKNKDIFLEHRNDFVKLNKFTMPDIQTGSIVELEYTVVSPDIFNFRSWQFQTDIPKLKSDYRILIPAIYKYNITLKGPLKLSDTKSKLQRECLVLNGNKIDCSDITYFMEGIPAFKAEAYMLAPKNYISAVSFELEEMAMSGGGVKSFTKKWSDVDRELMTDKDFGGQLKKTNLLEEMLTKSGDTSYNQLDKAKNVFKWVQQNIKWNNTYGKYAQNGIEDALKNKKGNSADINLSLITALNAAGIESYPILVSTRDNGIPNSLHPVISDFNYVIAGVKIQNETYLADATDPLLPFGELPMRCINEKGRIVFSKKSSEWIPLINNQISSTHYNFDGSLDPSGVLKGSLTIIYNGMDAVSKRRNILEYPSREEYQEAIDDQLTSITVKELNIENLDNNEISLIENFTIETKVCDEIKGNAFYFNPIFINRTIKNPFNLNERNYHVDIGSRRDESHTITIKLPKGSNVKTSPKNVSLVLPENTARYNYKSELVDDSLHVTQQLSLKKAIYNTDEYFGLKELFSRVIQQLKIDHSFNYTADASL